MITGRINLKNARIETAIAALQSIAQEHPGIRLGLDYGDQFLVGFQLDSYTSGSTTVIEFVDVLFDYEEDTNEDAETLPVNG